MNERLLILAATSVAHVYASPDTIPSARSLVLERRETIWNLLRVGGTFSQIEDWKRSISDCDAWLAAADQLSEQTVSSEDMLRSLLNRACAEHDRVKGLVETWREQAGVFGRAGASATDPHEVGVMQGRSDAFRACAVAVEQALAEPTDAPISDPAERAKAVAKELRRRGIWCDADVHNDRVLVMRPPGQGTPGNVGAWHDLDGERTTMGPLAIADRIQAEEAKRAKAWAGDL